MAFLYFPRGLASLPIGRRLEDLSFWWLQLLALAASDPYALANSKRRRVRVGGWHGRSAVIIEPLLEMRLSVLVRRHARLLMAALVAVVAGQLDLDPIVALVGSY